MTKKTWYVVTLTLVTLVCEVVLELHPLPKTIASWWQPEVIDAPQTEMRETEIPKVEKSHSGYREKVAQQSNVVTAGKMVSEGQRLMARGRHRDARDAFARAAELDEENAFAWANLGAAEMILGEPRAAKRAYDAALRADSDNWLALYNLGVYFVRTGDDRQAFQRLSESLRVLQEQGSQEELGAVLHDLETNSTFAGVRHDPQFRSLLAR